MQLLRSRSDADDALQETFLRVSRYGNQGRTNDLGWLYRIAQNQCFDMLKRRGRDAPGETAEAFAVGRADDGDTRAVLGAALTRLDGTTRTIGVLHHLGGLTQEEVAQETGYSRRTVGKKLSAFEALLRQFWKEAQ
jgi:RNA polymerase sigma-70 factor, ECF subfamily